MLKSVLFGQGFTCVLFLITSSWMAAILCLVFKLLEKSFVTCFAVILVAFMDQRIIEGPYSILLYSSKFLLVVILDFLFILLQIFKIFYQNPIKICYFNFSSSLIKFFLKYQKKCI